MIAAVVGPAALLALLAQSPTTLPSSGQQIVVHDGDTVVVDGNARIRVVRRIEAQVRAVFDSDHHTVVVLADEADAASGGATDGSVDEFFVFDNVAGNWPLSNRWEGRGVIEQYTSIDRATRALGYGLETPAGFIQLVAAGPFRSQPSADSRAVSVLMYRGSTGGPVPRGLGFDAAEQRVIAEQASGATHGNGAAVTAGVAFGPITSSGGLVAGPAAVRVGGGIQPPTKIFDVKPAYPPDAMAARVQGVVVIEATIGIDGSVLNARVLRSIPMLDDAAVAAVKGWRYTPTLVNGVPVPVIMTVTVNFALQN